MTQKSPTRHRVPVDRATPARPPRLGKIRLGIQKTSAKGSNYPSAIDYFRVDVDESGITSPAAVEAFHAAYGDEPKTLHVMLLGDRVEHVFESARRLYGANKLKRICTGTTCSVRQKQGGWLDQPCLCDAEGLAADDSGRCKLTHTLWLALPDLQLGPGLWELDTSSEISQGALLDYLLFIENARGSLMFYEFDLQLVATMVQPEGFDKAKKVYTLQPVSLASDRTLRDVIEQARQPRMVIEAREVAELPPAPVIDEERDPLISPTPEEEAAAPVPARATPRAVATSFGALSESDQTLLVTLAAQDGHTITSARTLMNAYGNEATDCKTLLENLRGRLDPAPVSSEAVSENEQKRGEDA